LCVDAGELLLEIVCEEALVLDLSLKRVSMLVGFSIFV